MRRAVDIFRVPYTTRRDQIAEISLVLVLGACEVVSLTKVRPCLVTNAEIRTCIVKGTSYREFGLIPSKMQKHDCIFLEDDGSWGGGVPLF